MTKPRQNQICFDATPYYHCVSRCVRRAFLCGYDRLTGASYEHRKDWIEEELIKQAHVFTIDLAAYAIMSNHYHVVLHINQSEAKNWSFDEVIERWHLLYKGNVFSQCYLTAPEFSQAERDKLDEFV